MKDEDDKQGLSWSQMDDSKLLQHTANNMVSHKHYTWILQMMQPQLPYNKSALC